MEASFFEIAEIPCEIIRKPIKSMRLRVYPPHGQVRISVPLHLSFKDVEKFVLSKHQWIQANRQHFQKQSPILPQEFTSGEQHDYLGQGYALQIHETKKKPFCALEDQTLCLYLKCNASLAEKENLLNKWYQQQLMLTLQEMIPLWEAKIGVQVQAVTIRAMKSRWGSCNPRLQRITMNLSLIKKPLTCIEYVLVHELVHLLEPSHNARFYRFMQQFIPDWKNRHCLLHGKNTNFNL